MIIDFHTHFFPDKIAPRAIQSLSELAKISTYSDGTLADTIKGMDEANITHSVMLSIATNGKQNKNVNDFAIESNNHERIIAFGSVHPDADWRYELDRLKDAGIKGIKLHPDYQKFFIDDPAIIPIYEYILKNEFILVFHTGLDIGLPSPIHATPQRIHNIFSMIQGEKVVLAHLGGFSLWEDVEKYILGEDIYLDTSYAAFYMGESRFYHFLQNHKKGRLLLGTDLPWGGQKQEVAFIKNAPISEELKEEILYKKCMEYFGDGGVGSMLSARETALKILYEVEENGAYLNIVFKNFLEQVRLSREDSALVKEITFGVVKHKIWIDYTIQAFSKIKLRKISPYILAALRMGIYQLKFMDKIPESAAVNESVKLAKKYGHKASSGFVNAILRNIAKGEGLPYPDPKKDFAKYLSIRYSHPKDLVQFLLNIYDRDFTENFLRANNETPPLYIRTNLLKTSRESLIKTLAEEGVLSEPAPLVNSGLKIMQAGNIERKKAYKAGLFTVQDQSSQLAALALHPQKGQLVLDMCAAPGGKTTHMAELMGNEGKIIAFDIYENRLKMVEDTAKRLGITIINTQKGDATEFLAEYENRADKILLDVPCSGLGVIRRKPDIKHKVLPQEFDKLVEIQKNILNNCAKYLKIEGELLYSTCTILPKENLQVIENFLKENKNFEMAPIENEQIPKEFCQELKKGYCTIYPHIQESDGFFICKLKRRA